MRLGGGTHQGVSVVVMPPESDSRPTGASHAQPPRSGTLWRIGTPLIATIRSRVLSLPAAGLPLVTARTSICSGSR